mgnify:CR=1 FL=1
MVMKKTHLAAGLLTWILLSSYLKLIDLNALFFSVFASLLPDFDLRIKHRALLHNLFAMLALASLVLHYFGYLNAVFFTLAYFSHILLDSLTKVGVSLLYPFSKKRYGLRLFRNGSLFDKFIFFSFTAMFLLLFIKMFSSVEFTEFLKEFKELLPTIIISEDIPLNVLFLQESFLAYDNVFI